VDGGFVVLERNGRVPSGVSYMLTNRVVMMKQLFSAASQQSCGVQTIEQYQTDFLLHSLRSCARGEA